MKYLILFICILSAGCASKDVRMERQRLREESRALEARQRAHQLATESEYECVNRRWGEIGRGMAIGGFFAGAGGGTEGLRQHEQRVRQMKEEAAFLCHLKAKQR